MIRPITPRDFPWCHALCGRAYPGEWDAVDGEVWFTETLRREDRYLVRGEHCLLLGGAGRQPYNMKKVAASMEMLASDGRAGFELMQIVRSFVEWARGRGAVRFTFDSRDDIDFAPIARRFGAKPYGPAYVVEL